VLYVLDKSNIELEDVGHGVEQFDQSGLPGTKIIIDKQHLLLIQQLSQFLHNGSIRDSVLMKFQPQLQVEVREQVGARLVAADTMNYWINNTPGDLSEMLKRIDMLIINDAEAREIAKEANLVRAARRILSMGPKRLVVKRGEYGAAMFTEHSYFATPAYPLEEVFDPTGAGDSFAGGFMGYLAATNAIDDAAFRRGIIYGSVMASFNVEEFGCERMRRLTYEEINSRFRELRAFSNFEEAEMPPF